MDGYGVYVPAVNRSSRHRDVKLCSRLRPGNKSPLRKFKRLGACALTITSLLAGRRLRTSLMASIDSQHFHVGSVSSVYSIRDAIESCQCPQRGLVSLAHTSSPCLPQIVAPRSCAQPLESFRPLHIVIPHFTRAILDLQMTRIILHRHALTLARHRKPSPTTLIGMKMSLRSRPIPRFNSLFIPITGTTTKRKRHPPGPTCTCQWMNEPRCFPA